MPLVEFCVQFYLAWELCPSNTALYLCVHEGGNSAKFSALFYEPDHLVLSNSIWKTKKMQLSTNSQTVEFRSLNQDPKNVKIMVEK